MTMREKQYGGFVLGLVAGLLIGLALALGVALYITKAPVPFVNKVPPRTAEQDNAETLRNQNWDPNAALGAKSPTKPDAAPAAAPVASAPAAPAPGTDPAALLAGAASAPAATAGPGRSTTAAAEPFVYFVQAGAYARSEEADKQRARLALLGEQAKVTEREQSGRTVYRVRLGPYETRDEADGLQVKLAGAGVEARLVRVERP